jgi:dTDP-L-rhamnose 4-epimerase
MRVLVTGGAGFIGSAVVQELDRAGHQSVIIDSLRADVHGVRRAGTGRRPVGETEPVSPAVHSPGELIVADIRDPDAVNGALAGCEAVVHLAAKVGLGVDLDDLEDYVASNDLGTAVLLRAVARAGIGRLVLAGSMVVYGEGAYTCAEHGPVAPGPRRESQLSVGRFEPPCPVCGRALSPGLVSEDAALDPRNGYAATKLHQEHLCSVWARETGGTVAALRFHNVYGPGMPRDTPYAGVAAIFRSALERGESPTVLEDGAQRRDFVEVSDVARAVVAALTPHEPAPAFRAYNIGSGRVGTIGELATLLAATMDGPPPVITGGYRLGDVRHVTASSERAARELGWRAQVSLMDGVRAFAEAPMRV